MTTAKKSPAIGDNQPAIITLFDKLHRATGEIEGIGREVVLDLFNNRAGYNLDLLALGNATSAASETRMAWLAATLPHHKAASEKMTAMKKDDKKPLPSDLIAFATWFGDFEILKKEIEADRTMINRAVPAAYYMHKLNASDVNVTGKGKRVLVTFEADSVDTFIHKPVINEGTGNEEKVLRTTKALTLSGLVENGDAMIAAHKAKMATTGAAVKTNAPRGKGKGKVDPKPTKLEGETAILATAETLTQAIASTTGEKLETVAKSAQAETLLCNVVAARFGKRNKMGNMTSIDIGELYTWLHVQPFFKGVTWTGHATTAELIKGPVKTAAAKTTAAK